MPSLGSPNFGLLMTTFAPTIQTTSIQAYSSNATAAGTDTAIHSSPIGGFTVPHHLLSFHCLRSGR